MMTTIEKTIHIHCKEEKICFSFWFDTSFNRYRVDITEKAKNQYCDDSYLDKDGLYPSHMGIFELTEFLADCVDDFIVNYIKAMRIDVDSIDSID